MADRNANLSPTACAMAIMGKASAPGRTKTRLVPPLRAADAAHLNTAFLLDMTNNLFQAQQAADIAAYVAYGPSGSEAFFRDCLPDSVHLIECSLPHFGDCLYRAVTTMLDRGHPAACVLNSDSPTLPTRYLIAAARALAQPGDRLVMGPCTDGGYYFLGVKHPHRRLFDDIAWSTERVYEQTRQRAAELGLETTVLDVWYDVDDAGGLERLRADLASIEDRAERVTGIYSAPHTRAALRRLAAQDPSVAREHSRVHREPPGTLL